MTVSNLYITTTDFKSFQRVTSVDTADDAVIDTLIEIVSRFVDGYTQRRFYPSIETHEYDIPMVDFTDRDVIYLDDDLLSLTTFTNGDLTAVTDYILKPANSTPYYAVKLRDTASGGWETNTAGSHEQVLSILGIWGYHTKYSGAWVQAGTLGAAIASTSTLSATMTAGHGLITGQLWKIDDEYLQGSVAANTLTLNVRGDNGSTASTHLINAPVYVWHPEASVVGACQQIVNSLYKKRFGENVSGVATVTAAGVVLTPADIPTSALKMLGPLMRLA
jgi:hypothetical protein